MPNRLSGAVPNERPGNDIDIDTVPAHYSTGSNSSSIKMTIMNVLIAKDHMTRRYTNATRTLERGLKKALSSEWADLGQR